MANLLQGLRIVEAVAYIAGPTAGLYCAQLGAEVIRIDKTGGGLDYTRWPRGPNGSSLYWENLNRGKKSVAVDFSRPEGRELMQRVASSTGIFLTNFPAKGFLAYENLKALRPDIIVVRVMGHADGRPALDYTVNAAVGFPGITGPAELGDTPVNHVAPTWDLLTGAYVAFMLLAAVRHRELTGEGAEVRVALADVAVGTVANMGMLAETVTLGHDRPRIGNRVYGAFGRDFVSKDGVRFMILALTANQWRGLVEVLGIESEVAQIEQRHGISLEHDEALRYAHQEELFALVEARVARRNADELSSALTARGCCFGPYQSMSQAARDPDMVLNNPMFGDAKACGLDYPAAGSFATMSGAPRLPVAPAPVLGADSELVLSELLGMDRKQIDALQRSGIVAA